MNSNVVIVAAKRTPFTSFGGSMKDLSANDLGAACSRSAIAMAGIDPGDIDHVVFGNVMQTSGDAIYHARHVGLKADVPAAVPALTVNRLCGSGFQAIVTAAQQILLGEASIVLAGGAIVLIAGDSKAELAGQVTFQGGDAEFDQDGVGGSVEVEAGYGHVGGDIDFSTPAADAVAGRRRQRAAQDDGDAGAGGPPPHKVQHLKR